MKENEVVQFLKDEVEIVTGLKCKVVPESDTWYRDNFCLDTGNLSLHLFLLGDLTENLLRIKEQIEDHKNRKVTTDDEIKNIIKSVAKYHDIKVSDIKSKRRTRDISVPRQIAMFLCREHTKSSLPEIGRQFGGKDHTTVLFAYKKISNLIKENNELKASIQEILGLIEKG